MDPKTVALLLTLTFSYALCATLEGEIALFEETGLTVQTPDNVQKVSENPLEFRFGIIVGSLKTKEFAARYMANEVNEGDEFIISSGVKLTISSTTATLLSVNDKAGEKIYFKVSLMQKRKRMRVMFSYLSASGDEKSISTVFHLKSPHEFHDIDVKVQRKDKEVSFYLDGEKKAGKPYDDDMHMIPTVGTELRLAQQYKKSKFSDDAKIGHIFIGSLRDTKIIFDKKASSAKPDKCVCDDGKGGPLKQGCVLDGIKYNENVTWTKDECNLCSCKKGQITCIHHCPVCRVDGKVYVHGDDWDSKTEKCTRCSCRAGVIKCGIPVVCPKPNCKGKSGDIITLPGQCCPICKEDQCIGTGKEFRCDCAKTCENKGSVQCSPETCVEGCYCPKIRHPARRKVQNDKGKCVRLEECTCKWKGQIYQPNEWWRSDDNCKLCSCHRAEMGCSDMCE